MSTEKRRYPTLRELQRLGAVTEELRILLALRLMGELLTVDLGWASRCRGLRVPLAELERRGLVVPTQHPTGKRGQVPTTWKLSEEGRAEAAKIGAQA